MKGWYGDKLQHAMASKGVRTARGCKKSRGLKEKVYSDDYTIRHLLGYLDDDAFLDAVVHYQDDIDMNVLYTLAKVQDDRYGTDHASKIVAHLGYRPNFVDRIYPDDETLTHMIGYIRSEAYADMLVNYDEFNNNMVWKLIKIQEDRYGGDMRSSVLDKIEEFEKRIKRATRNKFNLGKNIMTEADARQQAIDWQNWASEQNLSYGELAEYNDHFKKLGKRFGLTEEFEENGII